MKTSVSATLAGVPSGEAASARDQDKGQGTNIVTP